MDECVRLSRELARVQDEYKEMLDEAVVVERERNELKRENAAMKQRIIDDNKAYGCELRDPSGTIWDYAQKLQKENAELREDKARLDWLMTHEGGECGYWAREMSQWTPEVVASRDTIDAAREEAQP